MNGEPLPASHGGPLRVIVPGIAGARSVKWLDQITVAQQESQNHYMQRDYKVLPPDAVDAESAEKYWGITPPLMDMPCNSVVAVPSSEETVQLVEGKFEVRGYALPGGAQGPVVRVEISLDDGKTWREAEVVHPTSAGKWAWSLWRFNLTRDDVERDGKEVVDNTLQSKRRKITILSKATDKGGNTQEDCEWNLRGVAYNGYGEARDVLVEF